MSDYLSFQELISRLNAFWQEQGCVLIQPLDMEVGAGTFHPATFLRSIGPEPWSSAYVQPSRRPTDGRYGDNPNRLQHYYQYQVLLKPAPANLQELYLQSLQAVGIDLTKNDARFVEDNWESPTLGAWGLGWEVWLNGMEVTQFTYFQQVGGLECQPVSGELTYGLERLAMYLQGVDSVYDLVWTNQGKKTISYHQVYHQNEVEQSHYNFSHAAIDNLFNQFEQCYKACQELVIQKLSLPAYEQVMKASHFFNLLDARKAISVTERQRYIFRVRELASKVALCYADKREELAYPLGLVEKENIPAIAINDADKTDLQAISKGDFLFELGCEELPIDSLLPLIEEMKQGFVNELAHHQLAYNEIVSYATPRRLTIKVLDLTTQQASVHKKRKGPRVDAPEQARMGFARSCGVDLTELSTENYSGIDYLVYEEVSEGQHFSDLFPKMLNKIITKLPTKKTMRWEEIGYQFPRPVRWLVALLNSSIVPCSLFGLSAANLSYGHRVNNKSFGSSGIEITVRGAREYEVQLGEHNVVVDFWERKKIILQQLQAQAKKLSAVLNVDENLLNQVCSLTESPTVVMGDFPERFLSLPKECLITTLQTHQKYFTLSSEGSQASNKQSHDLLPVFLTVSNLPKQNLQWVKKGNERVVIPRLEDAEFFWQNDLKTSLESYLERLHAVVFVDGLGSMYQRVQRVSELAKWIATQIEQPLDEAKLLRACHLIKSDLVTDMVNEFPDLQGIMGKYYALASGEDAEVAMVIEEHYLPKKAYGELPQSLLSAVVAIADKVDSIVGIHILQKQPSGSSDPFSLRRGALGVMQILEHHKIALPVESLVTFCVQNWHEQLAQEIPKELASQVLEFMWARLYSLYTKDRNIPASSYQAVMAVQPKHPHEFMARLLAVQNFSKLAEAKILSETNTRIKNILQKNEFSAHNIVDESLLELAEEKALYQSLKKVQEQVKKSQDYVQILTALSELASPVENFFTHVMVLDEDLKKRDNRLNLLSQLRQCFLLVADISLLQLK